MLIESKGHNGVVALRLAVGLLGEGGQAGWWASAFTSPASSAFLGPVFGAKVLQARYQGLLEAARRVHDERIGVGRAFHLFRLPEALEQRLHQVALAAGDDLTAVVASPDAARAALGALADDGPEARPGPTLVGTADALSDLLWVRRVAALYSAAMRGGVQCFPYFSGAR
ncbi:BrxE family protein [Roseomonas sp. AR75]|uniref:BrxE family protein n=1 Tax=Roseomonas sp. AR75 TaxID=2562311 RepID=UPI0010C01CD3|nr:BrxE family protein [Roseomonas sp. AR75]